MKISKISLAFLRLYEQVDDSEDLEFSLGILSRSIMMDMILMMGIQKISIEYNESNYNEVVQKIKQYCEMIIADGTMYLINEVKDSESFSDDEKKEISINLASYFPNIINVSKNVPKLNKEFRFKHSEIYNQSKVVNIENNKTIYHLYNYYSKYDHLSHWTAKFQNENPFELRKGKLDLSILFMGTHLKRLLALAYSYSEGYEIFLPYIEDLGKSMKENFGEEKP